MKMAVDPRNLLEQEISDFRAISARLSDLESTSGWKRAFATELRNRHSDRMCDRIGSVKRSSALDATILSKLELGEVDILTTKVRVPAKHTQASTFFSIALLVIVFDTIRNLVLTKRLRVQSAALNFPLDRSMVVCVTETRLLSWKANHFGRPVRYLGDVPKSQILSAQLPYVSEGKWKYVRVHMRDGAWIQFLVEGNDALAFSQLLSPTA
jgi:hypothetical protein